MSNTTYMLGETSFDAVPEILQDRRDLAITSESTIARTVIHSIGSMSCRVRLKGKYMSPDVKVAIIQMHDSCSATGSGFILDDGSTLRNVLIESFETTPIIGVTEGYSFQLDLVILGEAA